MSSVVIGCLTSVHAVGIPIRGESPVLTGLSALQHRMIHRRTAYLKPAFLIDSTICRWKKKKISSVGSAATVAAAST